ncbi:MAG: hypothetical protein IJ714_06880 [Bacteroidales bacterium]|nr:hypothetical protein [Bacteroidales bacterium]
MTKRLHIALIALLGLSVLAACRQANPEEPSGEVQQVTEGPVNVSMDLSLKGFGEDNTLTKGDFYEEGNDFVAVNDSLFYDHEKIVKEALVFVFDAKGVSDPKDAKFEKAVNLEYADILPNNIGRVQFKLDKPYESIAVLILANYGLKPTDVSVTAGTTLENVVKYLSDPTNEAGSVHAIKSDQSKYLTEGVPMYGWKVFGSTGKLRFYSGMTTPLTVCGFTSVTELENYAKKDTGIGTVRDTDVVPMEFALARLQLRYNYKARGTGKESIAADSVTIKSVKLNVYKDKFYRLPSNLLDLTLPRTRETLPNPYDNISTDYVKNGDASDFNTGDVTFVEIPSKSNKSTAFVAYVPEISIKSVEDAIAAAMAASTTFEEPSLEVKVEVKVREKTDGSVVTYTYARNKITVDDGTNPPREYNNYGDEGWVSWLSFKTNQARKDKDNNVISIGTRYSLVRHYSYEWLAVGVNE